MIIEVVNLTKKYKINKQSNVFKKLFVPNYVNNVAIEDLSFAIEKGESVSLLGPNGAGKTTTMKVLTGLLYPTSGKVNVLGFTPFDRDHRFLSKIGFVMGNKGGLDWDLTAKQGFELNRRIYQISTTKFEKRVNQLVEMLNVEQLLNTQIRKLSLGERMKMEIVGAILHEPEILFLDEPTIGLDIISKQKIRNFLKNIQKDSNVTLVLTSHDMDDVEKVSDRIIILTNGKKVYDNRIEKLTEEYSNEKYIKFIYSKLPKEEKLLKYGEIIERGSNHYVIKVSKEKVTETTAQIMAKYPVVDIDILSIPLEEIIGGIFSKN